jgi:hypothetical protein
MVVGTPVGGKDQRIDPLGANAQVILVMNNFI